MTSIPMVESVAYFECGEVRRQICRVVTYPARRYCYAVGPSWQDYRDAHTILTRAWEQINADSEFEEQIPIV